jgi:hypothetical protein
MVYPGGNMWKKHVSEKNHSPHDWIAEEREERAISVKGTLHQGGYGSP